MPELTLKQQVAQRPTPGRSPAAFASSHCWPLHRPRMSLSHRNHSPRAVTRTAGLLQVLSRAVLVPASPRSRTTVRAGKTHIHGFQLDRASGLRLQCPQIGSCQHLCPTRTCFTNLPTLEPTPNVAPAKCRANATAMSSACFFACAARDRSDRKVSFPPSILCVTATLGDKQPHLFNASLRAAAFSQVGAFLCPSHPWARAVRHSRHTVPRLLPQRPGLIRSSALQIQHLARFVLAWFIATGRSNRPSTAIGQDRTKKAAKRHSSDGHLHRGSDSLCGG